MHRPPVPPVAALRPEDHAWWVTTVPTASYAYQLRREIIMGVELALSQKDLKRLVNSLAAYARCDGRIPTATGLYEVLAPSCGPDAWPLCFDAAAAIERNATWRVEAFGTDLERWRNPAKPPPAAPEADAFKDPREHGPHDLHFAPVPETGPGPQVYVPSDERPDSAVFRAPEVIFDETT